MYILGFARQLPGGTHKTLLIVFREFPGSRVVRTLPSHDPVQSLVGELRSHKLHGVAKKINKIK